MRSLISACRPLALVIVSLMPLAGAAADFTLDSPTANITPDIPVGKSLVIPIAASNATGGGRFTGSLTYRVTTSNARIQPRIKTGNPILRFRIKYEGTSPFEGDLDLQLFRDLAPVTSHLIAGLAQAGFYDNILFHRIISNFVVQAGDPAGNGTGFLNNQFVGLPFNIEHEFQPALTFTGRGQLAMANSAGGYNRGVTNRENSQVPAGQIGLGDFSATNGSQFFITTSNQHDNLDFKHTIFGQLVRGWPLLAQMNSVAVDTANKPTSPVRILSASILPGTAEATLMLGALGAGSANIVVTATDSTGQSVSTTFVATAKRETVNNRPVMNRLSTIFLEPLESPSLLVSAVDLEKERTSFGVAAVVQNNEAFILPNFIGTAAIAGSVGPFEAPGVYTLAIGVSDFVQNSANTPPGTGFDTFGNALEFNPFQTYSWQTQRVVVGKKPLKVESQSLEATTGTAANLTVARFSDTDPGGTPAAHAATINWGDGTAEQNVSVVRDPSRPGAALFVVSGTHTYARRGVYSIVTAIKWNVPVANGSPIPREVTRVASTVVVSDANATLRAQGATLDIRGPRVANRILATFTDTDRTRRPIDYVATVDWGDGTGERLVVVKTGPGRFAIRGSHTYRDPVSYAVNIRVHPTAAPDASGDVFAWSTVNLSGFTAPPAAPPFPIVNLRASWDDLRFANTAQPGQRVDRTINKGIIGGRVDPFVPANLQVRLAGRLSLNNSGDRASAGSSVRAWLSTDANLTTSGAGADTRLRINSFDQITVGAFGPGASADTGTTPWLIDLPRGESGGRKFLITESVFSDPIIDQSAVPKFTVIQIPAVILGLAQSGTSTTQAGGTVTFKVVLDTPPTASVTVPVTSSNTAQGTVSPAQLVFTSANWSTPQTVTVTGVNDNNPNTVGYTITVGPSASTDTLYNGLRPVGLNLSLTNKP